MVSTALEMSEDELIRALARIRREHVDDPAYKELRKDLPRSWPV
jgi:hypothetical protein